MKQFIKDCFDESDENDSITFSNGDKIDFSKYMMIALTLRIIQFLLKLKRIIDIQSILIMQYTFIQMRNLPAPNFDDQVFFVAQHVF